MNIYLKDYLSDSRDATSALQSALEACREGDTLFLGGGELHFYGEHAVREPYYVSNNDYSEKAIIFYLKNRRGLTIDGEEADLIFHGKVLPFVLDGSEGVVLRNFKVDYRHPFFMQAKITAAGEDFTDLYFDMDTFSCKVQDGQLCFYSEEDGWAFTEDRVLVTEFEGERPSPYLGPYFQAAPSAPQDFLAGMHRYLVPEQLDAHTIRLHGRIGYTHTVGNWWVCTIGGRHNPGIFLHGSKKVLLQNLRLYHTAAMGVIAQLSDDIELDRVCCVVRPGSGRVLSVSADATHFVNCGGKIVFRNCTFTSMLDDAGNFHGIYAIVREKKDEHTLLLRFGHPQQRGIPLYRAGEKLALVDNRTMCRYAILTVKESALLDGDTLSLTVEETLPAKLAEQHVVENFTHMPEVYLDGCTCGNNRPRGFLLTTCKKVVVENCAFYDMNSALECAGDANDWFESGPVTDVTIRHNRFVNAAYAGGNVITIAPVIKENIGQTYHRGIRIEENHFQLHEKRFLYARSVDGLIFRRNTYTQDDTLPAHGATGESGIHLEGCRNAVIEEPQTV